MRSQRIVRFSILSVTGLGLVTWSLIHGQERPAPPALTAFPGPAGAAPAPPVAGDKAKLAAPTGGAAKPLRDLSHLKPLEQEFHHSARRGADWLFHVNRSDGRFVYGCVPALKTLLEGDHYLRQAGAVFALAKAARFTGDPSYAARARQAVLVLLADTGVDPSRPGIRSTTLPPVLVNPLGAAGMLLMSIHELPEPAGDLIEQGEQLAAFIRAQQRPDGSLNLGENASDAEGINEYPGAALYGLMLSQRRCPAAWKIDLVRKALAYYGPWWRAHRNMAFVPWQSAAYTEAYLQTKEKAFADCVFEMNDWLCELQYPALNTQHLLWSGGFMNYENGKAGQAPPQVNSANYAESLTEACRAAHQAGDLAHYQRYHDALERCLQYLTRLQYTEGNTQHFTEGYRPVLVGAFFASFQDGNIRIDYTQHAVCAFMQYLLEVAE